MRAPNSIEGERDNFTEMVIFEVVLEKSIGVYHLEKRGEENEGKTGKCEEAGAQTSAHKVVIEQHLERFKKGLLYHTMHT